MTEESKTREALDQIAPHHEVDVLRAQNKELRDLLARYQEHVLIAEAALAAYEGRGDGPRSLQAGKEIARAGTLRILELLVSNKILEIARQGLAEVEIPWRQEFLRNPLAVARWGALRRAQRRLRRDPELRKRLVVLDHSSG